MSKLKSKVLKGIAVFQKKLVGYVSFIQDSSSKEVRVNGLIKNLKLIHKFLKRINLFNQLLIYF